MKCQNLRRAVAVLFLSCLPLGVGNAANILMVGNDPEPTFGHDLEVFDHLEALGHDVLYLAGADSTSADGQDSDLIVISSTLGSGSARGKFIGLGVPILNWEEAIMDGATADGNFAMGTGSENGTANPGSQIEITDPSHPLAAGLSGIVDFADVDIPRPHITGTLAPGVFSVAKLPSDVDGEVILSPSGTGMHIGTNQGGGNAFVGLMDEVALWDRSLSFEVDGNNQLTGGEVNTIFSNGIKALADQSGIIGYWDFDSGDVDIADDLGPEGHAAVMTGVDSTTDVPAVGGDAALVMEGFQVVDVETMERPGEDFAYSFWFNADSATYGEDFDTADPRVDFFYGNGNGGTVRPHLSANRNGAPLGIYVNADGDLATPIEATVDAFATDEWHHILINWDGETGTVFVNGVLDNSVALGEVGDSLFAITAVEVGGELTDGTEASEKVVNFPIQDIGFADLTDDGLALFDAAIAWLLDDSPVGEPGDFNGDGVLDAADINSLTEAIAAGSTDLTFDVSGDGVVSEADISTWAVDLKNTYIGDANLDGEFNSGDFVAVFTEGQYETGGAANWSQGDWTGDGLFNSGDFVAAFTGGGYEAGPRTATAAVPEPATGLAGLLAFFGLMARRRR